MDNRKCIGRMLYTIQEQIENNMREIDEVEYLSLEWYKKISRDSALRGTRGGVIATAFTLGIINYDEFNMCISDLIDELIK